MSKPILVRGSSVVEMLLFLPLFSLLLFAGTDLGLRFVERGTLSTTLRGAVNSHLQQASTMRDWSPLNNQSYSNRDYTHFRESIADAMFARIQATRRNRQDTGFLLGVVVLRFEQQSGQLLSYQLLQPLAFRGAANITQQGGETPDHYLSEHLSSRTVPSPFAMPVVEPENSSFAQESLGIVVQLSSGVSGFHPDFFLRLTNNHRTANSVLQETQFALLRTDLS